MAKKLIDLTLEELYSREKITPTVEKLIKLKDNFSGANETYCTKVCKYCHKKIVPGATALPDGERSSTGRIDMVILQDTWASPDTYKPGKTIDRIHNDIISYIIREIDPAFVSANWITLSVLKCQPTGKEEKVKDADLKRCSPYVLSELRRMNPKVILCLGTTASKILGCNKSVYSNRGEIVNSEFGPVVHSIHPKSLVMLRQNASGVMWGPDYYSCLKKDIEKAIRIAKGQVTPIFDLRGTIEYYRENRIQVCASIEEVRQAVQAIMELPDYYFISFDTETTGLDPFAADAKLLCIQFGHLVEQEDGNQIATAVVIPLWHRENTTIDPDKAWAEVEKVLLSPNKIKISHNGKFDIKYISVTKGIRVVNAMFDTMLMLHEINSGIQGNYGLKRAAWDYMYDSGIAGYEDLLPALTTKPPEEPINETEDAETE